MPSTRDSYIPDFSVEDGSNNASEASISFSTIQASNETPPISAKLPTSGIVSPAPPLLGLEIPSTSAFKITQLGPVNGSNVVVSRLDQPGNIYNTAATRSVQQSQNQRSGAQKYPNSNFGQFYHHPHPHQPHPLPPQLHQQNLVTKFTNMTVSNAGGKNPLKPTHFTVNTHQSGNSNFSINTTASSSSSTNSAPQPPRTTLKAADLIHILPNLVNTLKRRHSQSGQTGSALVAAVAAAAASNAANPGKSTAAFVAEQLLNVASTPFTAEDLGSSSPPSAMKRVKIHSSSSLHQCEVCGKIYKHRNCLSKHRWEHHDAWEHTKKVCQTKHQQVQLLEAAQVLAEIMLGAQPGQRRHQPESSEGEDGEGEEFVEIESSQDLNNTTVKV